MGENMYPKVPDIASPEVQGRSDGALFHIIQNGVRWTGMPAWKNEHSSEETWKLVAFIRRVPTLTEADLVKEKPVATSGEGRPGISMKRLIRVVSDGRQMSRTQMRIGTELTSGAVRPEPRVYISR